MITPKQIEKLYKWAGWIDIRNKPYHQLGANWQKDHEIYPDLPPADLNTFETWICPLVCLQIQKDLLGCRVWVRKGVIEGYARGALLNEVCWLALLDLMEKENG